MNCESYYILRTVYSAVQHIHDVIILHTPSLDLFFWRYPQSGFSETERHCQWNQSIFDKFNQNFGTAHLKILLPTIQNESWDFRNGFTVKPSLPITSVVNHSDWITSKFWPYLCPYAIVHIIRTGVGFLVTWLVNIKKLEK